MIGCIGAGKQLLAFSSLLCLLAFSDCWKVSRCSSSAEAGYLNKSINAARKSWRKSSQEIPRTQGKALAQGHRPCSTQKRGFPASCEATAPPKTGAFRQTLQLVGFARS